ncbi:hypothetical protein NKG94_02420 [Micromonospora sp. M12]
MLHYPDGDQVFLIGAHHAVADLASLMLIGVAAGAVLNGAPTPPATNDDIELLLRSQAALPGSPPAAAGTVRRGSAARPGAGPAPAGAPLVPVRHPLRRTAPGAGRPGRGAGHPSGRHPGGVLARRAHRAPGPAARPGPLRAGRADRHPAARGRGAGHRVLRVPIPYPAEVPPGLPAADLLRQTEDRLSRVRDQGVTFLDAMPALIEEGLHRPEAPLVEVYFNYMPPQALAGTGLEILPVGTGHFDLDLMVTVLPGLDRLGLEYNADILDDESCARFVAGYLEVVAEIAGDPRTPVTSPAPKVAVAATFALGNLPAMLGLALTDGDRYEVTDAPYHQVLASLHDPAGVFTAVGTVAGLVLLRSGDLTRFQPEADDLPAQLAEEYPAALTALADRARVPLIVGFLPERTDGNWARQVASRLDGCPASASCRRISGPRGSPRTRSSTSTPTPWRTCPSGRSSRPPWRSPPPT